MRTAALVLLLAACTDAPTSLLPSTSGPPTPLDIDLVELGFEAFPAYHGIVTVPRPGRGLDLFVPNPSNLLTAAALDHSVVRVRLSPDGVATDSELIGPPLDGSLVQIRPFDIDGDGLDEVIGYTDTRLFVLDDDGTTVSDVPGIRRSSDFLAVTDGDGDGRPEIWTRLDRVSLSVLTVMGTELARIPMSRPLGDRAITADLDGDGVVELITESGVAFDTVAFMDRPLPPTRAGASITAGDVTGDGVAEVLAWDDLGITAHDAANGGLVWPYVDPDPVRAPGRPMVVDGEVFVATLRPDALLRVLDGPSGTLLRSIPMEPQFIDEATARDLDGDGTDEILWAYGLGIDLFDPDRDAFTMSTTGFQGVEAHTGDLDGDGDLELLLKGHCERPAHRIYGLAGRDVVHDGSIYATSACEENAGFEVLADIDGDGTDELVVFSGAGVHTWRWAGNGFQLLSTSSTWRGQMGVAADLDGDGDEEVVTSDAGAVTAYEPRSGAILWTAWADAYEPFTADIDRDGRAEILVVGDDTTLFDDDGTVLGHFGDMTLGAATRRGFVTGRANATDTLLRRIGWRDGAAVILEMRRFPEVFHTLDVTRGALWLHTEHDLRRVDLATGDVSSAPRLSRIPSRVLDGGDTAWVWDPWVLQRVATP